MSEQLQNVWRGFALVRSYFKEITKLCERLIVEVEKAGYEEWTGRCLEYASSKSFSAQERWLPYHHYQFFGEAVPDDATAGSLLGVCIEHYAAWDEEVEQGEPMVYLVRFAGTTKHPGNDRNPILYQWDVGAEGETERDGFRWGTFREYTYAYRSLSLASITSLDQVKEMLVDPLVALDRAENAAAE